MFRNILLPVDLQETTLSQRAIEITKELSAQFGCRITVMTVIPDFGMPLVANFFPDDAVEQAERDVAGELGRFIDARFDAGARVRPHVATGTPHKVIVKYAATHKTDLIVLPAHGKAIGKLFLGSTSTHVAEHATCSVMVIRP